MITKSLKSARDPFLPVDLLIDIFSRVPAKSIARFRCVSKSWESLLGGQYFKELFLTMSVARPRLFFALAVNKELFVFSTPQPQKPVWNSSLVTTPYKACPKYFPTDICIPLYGLVFLRNWECETRVICNPITGESVTLPEVKEATGIGHSHFGFDPINKQFKVLSTTFSRDGTPNTHRVLTLGIGKLVWRPIHDTLIPHIIHVTHCHNEICINGVVYYRAYFERSSEIVCFNFSSERFGRINMDKDMLHNRRFTLFNYKGHLAAYQHSSSFFWCSGEGVFWVLEDAGKHKWSKRSCVLPFWGDETLKKYIFVGMTGTGEIVFSPYYLSNPFYIFYYNIERETFARFEIKGFEEIKHQHIVVHTFLDYVENMKFM